jgi:hypothetical protein
MGKDYQLKTANLARNIEAGLCSPHTLICRRA